MEKIKEKAKTVRISNACILTFNHSYDYEKLHKNTLSQKHNGRNHALFALCDSHLTVIRDCSVLS